MASTPVQPFPTRPVDTIGPVTLRIYHRLRFAPHRKHTGLPRPERTQMDKTAIRGQLKEMLCSISLQMNAEKEYELHSGAKSSVYVDAKITTCSPKAIPLVGRVFLNKIEQLGWTPEAVGGLTVGADPIAIAIAR